LGTVVGWDRLDEFFGAIFCPENRRHAASTRLMAALHCLKSTFDLSDEDAGEGWFENPSTLTFGRR
jgi:IS5 family transposase